MDDFNKKRPLADLAKWPFLIEFLVGIAGFEPTTSASRRQRSTKLSYIPKVVETVPLKTSRAVLNNGANHTQAKGFFQVPFYALHCFVVLTLCFAINR